MKLEIIPFRARHLHQIAPGASDRMIELALYAEENGTAYSLALLGDVIGAAGVAILRPGAGEAWSLLTPLCRRFRLTLHREAKRRLEEIIDAHGLKRIYALCDDTKPAAAAWLLRLGFKRRINLTLYVRRVTLCGG